MARVRRLQHVSAQKEREMRIPRSRGAISGVLLVALGAWGAIVPFIGPSFNLTIGPDTTFDMTQGRLWLSLLPGVVAALGGLMLLFSANRATAILGAQMALAAGVWFIVGPTLSQLWSDAPGALGQAGYAAGDEGRRVLEAMAYFYGVGAAITAFAALALGRLTLRSARDVELAEGAAAAPPARRTRRFARDRDRAPVAEPAAGGATPPPRGAGLGRRPVPPPAAPRGPARRPGARPRGGGGGGGGAPAARGGGGGAGAPAAGGGGGGGAPPRGGEGGAARAPPAPPRAPGEPPRPPTPRRNG